MNTIITIYIYKYCCTMYAIVRVHNIQFVTCDQFVDPLPTRLA